MSTSDPRDTRISPGPGREAAPTGGGGDLTDELVEADWWTDEMVQRAGIPIVDVPFVSVGGGIGSFVMADYLRIAGVPSSDIKVLTRQDTPWETYQRLTTVSQIPPQERLRSDSASTPDNIWGFPSYAWREAAGAHRISDFIAPFWSVLTEPVFTDYWTPKAGQVFRSMAREADRIDYWSTVEKGQVRMVRRRSSGGYFTILTPDEGSGPKRVAYRSRYVHVAVGYPGLKFLDDLQEYRTKHGDTHRVVNAYEGHEHVYQELLGRGHGKVVLRGSGIVASRILQRLIDDRDRHRINTEILHLFRNYVSGPHGPSVFMRRKGGQGWAYQGFNWPKSTWGGQLKSRLESLEGQERVELLRIMGGTNTPTRKLWQRQLERGREEGFYRTYVGEVTDIRPEGDMIRTTIRTKNNDTTEIPAHFIIDATGLEGDIRESRVLADLLDHGGAARNPLGRLDVARDFEVRGTRSGDGRMYAAGAMTLGGYFAGVDTFLGLQYSALQIADDLARLGFGRRIGVVRSLGQWWKWVFYKKP